jgi:hypothetical protein
VATRLNHPLKAVPNWDRLMQLVLVRSQTIQDNRYRAFQLACNKGQSQEILKRYGIISEGDIEREFPVLGE